MIPKVAKPGLSFKGALSYYLHDKEHATTSERVGFTRCLNLLTDDPWKASKAMAWTYFHAKNLKRSTGQNRAGKNIDKSVYSFSLSWAVGENPSDAEMERAGKDVLRELGLEKHEAVLIAHNDMEYKHIHVVANRVDPETGKAADMWKDRDRLSRWAEHYEKEHGTIHCDQRVKNNAQREHGKPVKYREPIIQNAWNKSDSGKAFRSALQEHGYILARGDKRPFVVVDPYGKTINPLRQIEGVKMAAFKERLSDLEPHRMPTAEEVLLRQQLEKERGDSDGESGDGGGGLKFKPDRKTEAQLISEAYSEKGKEERTEGRKPLPEREREKKPPDDPERDR